MWFARTPRWAVLVGGLSVLVGCFADIAPPLPPPLMEGDVAPPPDVRDPTIPTEPEVLPEEHTVIEVSTTFSGSAERLVEGPVIWAIPSSSNGVLIVHDSAVRRLDATAQVEHEWDVSLGTVLSAAMVDPDQVLIATTDTLYAVGKSTLAESPVAALLDGATVQDIVVDRSAGTVTAYLATSDGPFEWSDGHLAHLTAEQLTGGSEHVGFGAPLGGLPALWVESMSALVAVWSDPEGRWSRVVHPFQSLDDMAVDSLGQVWIVSDGALYRRDTDEVWEWLDLGGRVEWVSAHPESQRVWLGRGDQLWHRLRGETEQVFGSDGLDSLGTIQRVVADSEGRALLTTDQGVWRLALGRPLVLDGLDDGAQLLEEPALVSVFPARPEQVDDISALLNGLPTPVLADPHRIVLDPAALDADTYELVVTVTYRDIADSSTASIFFTVGEITPITWTDDIEPLSRQYCLRCHGPTGTAHFMYTPRAWEAEFAEVLSNVEDARMPLGANSEPLADDEIQLIRDWRAGGFQR